MLGEVGLDVGAFRAALAAQGVSMDAVLASLAEMEARQAAHDEKLDRMLRLLQGGKELRDKPADIIEWGDIRIKEERAVGVGGFGRVYIGTWKGNTVAVKAVEDGGDVRAMAKGAAALRRFAACPAAAV